MVDYNDGNWHGWNGGECPVHPDSVVEYVWVGSCGPVVEEESANMVCWKGYKGSFIAAFRVVKEHKEPREFWIDVHGCVHDDLESARFASPYASPIHVREVVSDD